jgi:peptide/nickel transport system permease protein
MSAVEAVAVPARRPRSVLSWIAREKLTTACLAVLVLTIVGAVAAPIIAPYHPQELDLEHVLAGPSPQHLLGTDYLGRDIFSRLLYGARTALLGPLLVIVIATVSATLLALLAAWRGGVVDQVISGAFDVLFSFPGLLLAIAAVAVFGTGLVAPVIALGIAYTPYIGRIIRSSAMRERRLPYVEALTVQGVSAWQIARKHLLVNTRTLILAQSTLAFGYATLDLAGISYLGLGVQPPSPDWGLSVAQGQAQVLAGHPAQSLYPGVALIVVVVSVTLLGRRIGQRADQPAGATS